MSYIGNKAIDETLKYIQNNANKIVVNSVVSTDYATVAENNANILATITVTSGDFTITNNADTNAGGRTLTYSDNTPADVTKAGTFKQVAFINDTGGAKELLLVFDAEQERALTTADKIILDDQLYTITGGI